MNKFDKIPPDVKEYYEKRIRESNIKLVSGHYPVLLTKEEVDQFFDMSYLLELDPQMQDTTSVTFHNSKENATVTVTIPGYFPDELSEKHRQKAYKKLTEITSEEFAANSLIYSWIVNEN